ncbi:MAG: pyridoxamine 5-phosphate oxidase-related FMN-binding protein [Actinomycetia bacterium]|nr:pyridoxamine 5-phosphate oxidase-related FMN-binding protein [Actinomycetes bacterium]
MLDHGGALEALDEAECRELLCGARIGRVGVTVGGLPVILPVHYSWTDGDILFRTGEGTKSRAAMDAAVIAFEVDSYDEPGGKGWIVLAVGRAYEVTDRDALDDAERLDLVPWADGGPHYWVRMRPEFISGRRTPG